ncbi:glycosyltransferase family 4 protein [Thiomicrorhabdus lithotrophica]|uniref:Glycosyltransferase family 4 protein n=1 Tax=Thiomicrorhabdus lithotrophica TaxID=2949997 RepID=A0ABY8CEM8_9GAMM|nr:glycosyltransferase family 4 protein [Thiomicrorhabdus lithotrophica]WEJ63150.1 glycosyltransferase family 4 protein [Thiomicrorhabdus lithotrophica]
MNKPKTIWIINQYASTPATGMGGRHFYLAKELAKQGHQVYLIASSYTHLLRSPLEITDSYFIEELDGISFVWVKMPQYEDAHDKKRVLNWFIFAWRLLKLPKVIKDKPDVVLASSPAPFVFLGAQRLAKKFHARLVFEVRDIWPLTLIELGGYSSKHPFIRLMQWVEDKAYRESDTVLSNLPNAVRHMESRGMKPEKFSWIPNGFDTEEFSNTEPLSEETLQALPQDKFIVGYTGTLGVANALENFIDAAELLKKNDKIAFVLVGKGKEKKTLQTQVNRLKLKNVTFIDSIRKSQVQSMLEKFDACFIGWKKEAIYRYGIAPNKLPEYMLSATPIIHAYSGACDFVKEAEAGISVPAENPQAIAEAILALKQMSFEEISQLGQNGRNHALENYDYTKLAEKLSGILLD